MVPFPCGHHCSMYKVVQIWPGHMRLVYTEISPCHIWTTLYLQSEKASRTFLDTWFSIFVSSMAAIWQSILCDESFGWQWQNLFRVSEKCDRTIFIVSTERTTKFGSMIPDILCNKMRYFYTDQTRVDWSQKHYQPLRYRAGFALHLIKIMETRDVSFRNERFRRIESVRGLMRSASRSCEPVVHLDPDGFVSYSYSSFTNLHRSQTISFTCRPLSKGITDGYIC